MVVPCEWTAFQCVAVTARYVPEGGEVAEEVVAEKEEEGVDGVEKVGKRMAGYDGLELGVELCAVSFSLRNATDFSTQ
ncbi:2'-5' RNA ligase [Babesia caballi]|uniref:2'-5' RNA ligase n=1 Tax=Babesia caballi TaxID=5871 RepID=A0AAV4LY15_BABCB|nr:2'-5' RNA ligase [Babesia caballi]